MVRSHRGERGFTLIELMVVVLIIAILLAIAIPTFLGARQRANDRATQSNLRNAHTNELVWLADNKNSFTEDLAELQKLDASLVWTNSLPSGAPSRSVYVKTSTLSVSGQSAVVVGSMSRPNVCYWLRAVANQDHPRFAQNDCVAEPGENDFTTSW